MSLILAFSIARSTPVPKAVRKTYLKSKKSLPTIKILKPISFPENDKKLCAI